MRVGLTLLISPASARSPPGRCKTAETSFVQLYHSLHECADPAVVLSEALRLLEGRDGQVNNLLTAMEELNEELEGARDERERLESDLDEARRELEEARKGGGDGGGGGGPGGALSLAEREELIRLRSEVAEYEVEFRGLKNQDITIRKLESEWIVVAFRAVCRSVVVQFVHPRIMPIIYIICIVSQPRSRSSRKIRRRRSRRS